MLKCVLLCSLLGQTQPPSPSIFPLFYFFNFIYMHSQEADESQMNLYESIYMYVYGWRRM